MGDVPSLLLKRAANTDLDMPAWSAKDSIVQGIAEASANEGASVALCARDPRQVDEAVAAFRKQGTTAFGTALDISDHDALKAWVERAAEQMGGIDVVVANPSSFGIGVSELDWQNGYSVDLMGTVHTVEAATPHLEKSALQSGDASILIISSVLVAEADCRIASCGRHDCGRGMRIFCGDQRNVWH